MKERALRVLVILLTTVLLYNNTYVWANDDSLKEQMDKNNQQLDDLKNKRDDVTDSINKEQSLLEDLEKNIELKHQDLDKAKADVDVYQKDIDLLKEEITTIEVEIQNVEEEIKSREEAINLLIEEQKVKERLLDDRIRNYYKLDVSMQYIYILLKSENIYEAVNNVSFIYRVINLDRDLITETKEKEIMINEEKQQLDISLEEQVIRKESIVEKQDQLVQNQKEFIEKKEIQESMLNELEAMESEKNNLITSLEQQGSNLDNKIGDLVAYNKELQQQLDDLFKELNNGSADNVQTPGVPGEVEFLRPVAGGITDTFGPRINPVTGEAGQHNGIDYATNYDVPIAATKSGVVEYSGWISGYGNTIIINHGGGIQSLYGHANSLAASVGKSVSQGEIVAYVGSTGMSTGPHLHFEIRINGKPVDPYIYIPY